MLTELAWQAVALEYGCEGAEVCAVRGIPVVRADATRLPIGPAGLDLVVAFDVLEHIEDDKAAVRGVFEALRPGGRFLVAVPADPALWSAHDEAVGHVRRYTRQTLHDLLAGGGFEVGRMRSWNVLLRPVVAARRRTSTGSDLEHLPRWLNAMLHAVVVTERYLPVKSMPGVSLPGHRPPALKPLPTRPPTHPATRHRDALAGRGPSGGPAGLLGVAPQVRARRGVLGVEGDEVRGAALQLGVEPATYSPSRPRQSNWIAPITPTATTVDVQPGMLRPQPSAPPRRQQGVSRADQAEPGRQPQRRGRERGHAVEGQPEHPGQLYFVVPAARSARTTAPRRSGSRARDHQPEHPAVLGQRVDGVHRGPARHQPEVAGVERDLLADQPAHQPVVQPARSSA